MKKLLIPITIVCLMLALVPAVFAAPWVYPASESDPTGTSYWTQVLGSGTTTLSLVLWNHDKNDDFRYGNFVIAIKSGLSQVTIDSVKIGGTTLSLDKQDVTTPYTTPGHPFPPGGIFPCPWKQYEVPDLADWEKSSGWQGSGDDSGVQIDVTITVTGAPQTVKLYFLAWGYYREGSHWQKTDTPYSHITQTVPPVNHSVPEVPLGTVIAGAIMAVGLVAYTGIRKRKTPQTP